MKLNESVFTFENYTNKKGIAKKALICADGTAFGFFTNAVNVAKNANRVKLQATVKSGTVVKKLCTRDSVLTSTFTSCVGAYNTMCAKERELYLDTLFKRLQVDDSESYECVDTALVALYAYCAEHNSNFPTIEAIATARTAVNSYLAAETKAAKNTVSLQDVLNDFGELSEHLKFNYDGILSFTADESCEHSRVAHERVQSVLAKMRRFEKIAVLTYGSMRSLSSKKGGNADNKKQLCGYGNIAAYLNDSMSEKMRTVLYNFDKPLNIKGKKSFEFNTANVRHAVEKFRTLYSESYPYENRANN